MNNELYGLLHQLGLTSNYTGFFFTDHAVSLAVQQPECLLLEALANHPLDTRPTASQFLSILAERVRQTSGEP